MTPPALTADQTSSPVLRSPGYELFIIVTTAMSIVNWVFLVLPFDFGTDIDGLLIFMDPLLTLILLIDFGVRFRHARPHRRQYMRHGGGWFDLLGSLPYLHMLRLFRLWRGTQAFREYGTRNMMRWFVANRANGALFLVLSVLLIVLEFGGILVLHFEVGQPGANIETGGQALWWGVVTIATVGYGDYYPVTGGGRITATVMIFAGLALVGVFTAWAAAVFMAPAPADAQPLVPLGSDSSTPDGGDQNAAEQMVADLRAHIDHLEAMLRRQSGTSDS